MNEGFSKNEITDIFIAQCITQQKHIGNIH